MTSINILSDSMEDVITKAVEEMSADESIKYNINGSDQHITELISYSGYLRFVQLYIQDEFGDGLELDASDAITSDLDDKLGEYYTALGGDKWVITDSNYSWIKTLLNELKDKNNGISSDVLITIDSDTSSIYDLSNNMFSNYVEAKKDLFDDALSELSSINNKLNEANDYFALMVDLAAQDDKIKGKNLDTDQKATFQSMLEWMEAEKEVDFNRYFDDSVDLDYIMSQTDKGKKDSTLSKAEVQGLKAQIDTFIKSLEAEQSKQSIEVNQYLTRMNEGLGWWGGKIDSFDRLWNKITSNF